MNRLVVLILICMVLSVVHGGLETEYPEKNKEDYGYYCENDNECYKWAQSRRTGLFAGYEARAVDPEEVMFPESEADDGEIYYEGGQWKKNDGWIGWFDSEVDEEALDEDDRDRLGKYRLRVTMPEEQGKENNGGSNGQASQGINQVGNQEPSTDGLKEEVKTKQKSNEVSDLFDEDDFLDDDDFSDGDILQFNGQSYEVSKEDDDISFLDSDGEEYQGSLPVNSLIQISGSDGNEVLYFNDEGLVDLTTADFDNINGDIYAGLEGVTLYNARDGDGTSTVIQTEEGIFDRNGNQFQSGESITIGEEDDATELSIGADGELLVEQDDGYAVADIVDGKITAEGNPGAGNGGGCDTDGDCAGSLVCSGGVCMTSSQEEGVEAYKDWGDNWMNRLQDASQWASYGTAFSQLFFGRDPDDDDSGFINEWRSEMADFFTYNEWGQLLSGDFATSICRQLTDVDKDAGGQGLFMDLGGGNQALGLSVSGEVWEYTNATGDTEYLYKVTYYAYNPNDDENRFNVKFCADAGCSDYEYWFPEHKELASYGSYSGTGNNKIVAYHDRHFPKVCVVLDDEIRIWDDDPTDEFCNRLVLYDEDNAPASTSVVGSGGSGASGGSEGSGGSDDSGYKSNFR